MSSNNKNNFLSRKINNILIYLSCLLVLLMPTFFIPNISFPYISSKVFLFYTIVEVMLAFSIYSLIIDSSFRLKNKTYLYFIPIVGFIIWMTIAGILAVNPHMSFWSTLGRGTGLITLYHCLVFAFIIASLVKRNGISFIYKIMNWFIVGGFILALSVWFGDEGFNAIYLLKGSQGGGLLGNSSLTATYLLFPLAFGISLIASKKYEGSKWWIGTMVATILFSPLFINIYGLFSGHSLLGSARGATLGIILGVGVSLMLYLSFSKKRIISILGILGLVLGFAVLSFLWIQLETPGTKIHDKFVEAASGTRFIFADSAKKSMSKHPWFGYGPENYSISFQENFNPEMALEKYNLEVWTDRAHNLYYDIGATGGYPSIFLYALFILLLIFGIYKLRNKEDFSHMQVAILIGLVVGYIFQNLFVFDSPLSLMSLFLLAGIIFASNDYTKEEKFALVPLNTFKKDVLPFILSIACLISLFYLVGRPLAKTSAYYEVMNTSVNSRASRYVDLIGGSSLGEDWDLGGMGYDTYKFYNTDPIKIKNDIVLLPNAIKDIKALIAYLEMVQVKNQSDVRLDMSIAYLYNTLNFFSDTPYNEEISNHMFKYLNHALSISPTNPGIYWGIAQVYIWKRDFKGVEDTYKKAIAIDPSIPDSHSMLIKVARIIKDKRMYDEAIAQAEKDIPNFQFK